MVLTKLLFILFQNPFAFYKQENTSFFLDKNTVTVSDLELDQLEWQLIWKSEHTVT